MMVTLARDGEYFSGLDDGTVETYTLGDTIDYFMTTNTTPTTAPQDVLYFPLTYQVVATIFYILVGLAGVIGNSMVILVVWRVPHMRTPTNCYLVSLAVADSITGAVAVLLHSVPENLIPKQTFIYGIGMCYFMIPLEYVAFNVSALSITAFTVERYIAISHPMRAKLICSVSRATKIIVALWIFGFCYSVLYIVMIDFSSKTFSDGKSYQLCGYRQDRASLIKITYLIDVVLYYVIPVGLSAVLYSLIGLVLFKSTKMSSNMQCGYEPVPLKTKTVNGVKESPQDKIARKKKEKQKKPKDNTVSSRKQVVKMLVVVVTLFGVLWAPYRILVVYNSVKADPSEQYWNMWFLFFCRICIYINSAVNPILYNFMSVKFRNAFSSLCRCGKPKHPRGVMSGYSQTENTML